MIYFHLNKNTLKVFIWITIIENNWMRINMLEFYKINTIKIKQS